MVRIRLNKRKKNTFQIVAIDRKKPRDSGKILEYLGFYNPHNKETNIANYEEGIKKWIIYGAKPTKTVIDLLKRKNINLKFF